MKVKTLTIIILPFVVLCSSCVCKPKIANGITGDKIKEIKMGMPLEEVISILGKPYEIENFDGSHDFSCKNPKLLEMNVDENTDIIHIVDNFFNTTSCCEAYEESKLRFGKRIKLTYTKKGIFEFFFIYPMLWVHLDSNYCVRNVFAKLFDDICIYSLSWEYDETTLEEIPGKESLFINEELFDKCFKK